MKIGYKILAVSAFGIVAIGSIPLFVNLKKNNDTKYTFNLSKIIDYCKDDANTLRYFQDNYASKVYIPTTSESELWQENNPSIKKTICIGRTNEMTKEQMSYDIAFWIANWWMDVYKQIPGTNFPPFLPGYARSDQNGYNPEWRKDWSFSVNVNKKETLSDGSLSCDFNVMFHCDSWQHEMLWASQIDSNPVNAVTAGGELSVVGALFNWAEDPSNPPSPSLPFHYHINTSTLDLQSQGTSEHCLACYRHQIYGNTWVDEKYGHFGGSGDPDADSSNPHAFEINSFILSKFAL